MEIAIKSQKKCYNLAVHFRRVAHRSTNNRQLATNPARQPSRDGDFARIRLLIPHYIITVQSAAEDFARAVMFMRKITMTTVKLLYFSIISRDDYTTSKIYNRRKRYNVI